jgi:hypothetical protein
MGNTVDTKKIVVAIVVLAMVVATFISRRRGYALGLNTPVRCQAGHLFTTVWIPGASVKSLRLGWWRFQRCPVGNHWTLVHPVKGADLTVEERESAAEHRDIRLP